MSNAATVCFYVIIFGFLFPEGCNSFGLLPSRETSSNTNIILSPINQENHDSIRRQVVIVSSMPVLLALGLPANAAETTAEAIRLISSKTIPGLGAPDIYYPSYFVGKWKTTHVITSSDDAFFDELQDRGVKLPIKVTSEMRFVPYDAGKDFQELSRDDANPNKVPAIADRSFNERSYHAALSEEIGRLYSSTKSYMPSIQNVNWTPTNPNVLSLDYSDGSSKEVKVTKRSCDVSNDGSNLFSSEFRRITAVPPSPSSSNIAGAIPSVYKSRVLTKWKKQQGSDDVIEGIEISYVEAGTLGEKMGGSGAISSLYGGDSKDLADWRSTKAKILMERI